MSEQAQKQIALLCRAVTICALFLPFHLRPATHAQTLYVATPGNILRLSDNNQDEDFLDYQEQQLFATGLSTALSGICHTNNRLTALDSTTNTLIRIEDLNGDGDAMDAGEIGTFAPIPDTPLPSPLSDLVSLPDGALLVARRDNGTLHRVQDINEDGDAMDTGEIVQVASGLTLPLALAARPDGAILVAQAEAIHTIRILRDRNGDGDYFDFAENLPYTDVLSAGYDLVASTDDLTFLSQPAVNTILRLQDLTSDGDCLDAAETAPYLTAINAPRHLAPSPGGGLYVLAAIAGNPVYLVKDINQDGDAFDIGEVTLVGNLPAAATAMACVLGGFPCIPGDYNHDGGVDMNDLPLFVAVLVGEMPAPDLCAADLNQDDTVNGLDVQWMVWRLTSG